MPRQSRGPAPAPRRPTVAPQRPAPPTQARQASTAAHPQQAPPAQAAPTQAAPAQQSGGGSGLFGQMASTAAGVAVGSSIGHAVGGWFSGGSSQPAAQEAAPLAAQDNGYAQSTATSNTATGACANDINNFRSCMDQNQGSLTICGWYLDQLKACQQAASQY